MSKNEAETKIRCGWLTSDPLYIKYHDEEWGKPEYNCNRLFEMICLEGQQAGLSWITILKKRENYRRLFKNFDPFLLSAFDESNISSLIMDSDIIRHKGKIEAIINNAKCYVEMENNGEDFTKFIWSFVNDKQIINCWTENKEIPTDTPVSLEMSKALKKKGFKYVGSTICYAFMQACGLVNDHLVSCIAYKV